MSSKSFHNSCEPCFPNDCKHDSTKYDKHEFKQRFQKCFIIDINSAFKHGFRHESRMRIRCFAIATEQAISKNHSLRVPQTRQA